MPTKTVFGSVAFLLFIAWTGAAVSTALWTLSDAEWRADIASAADAIREIHPRPFRAISETDFDSEYERLVEDIPELSDKEIIVRLAALVALVDDGHTRLALPREHPEIGLEFGHTPTPGPAHPALRFRQLPLAFDQFEDGIFVVAASNEYADLIGLRLVSIDGTPVAEAMQAVQAITFAENSQLAALMGVDRLSLPEALAALGITASAEVTILELADEFDAARKISVKPLPDGVLDWIGPDRVLLGTGMALQYPRAPFLKLDSLSLDHDTLRKIKGENASRLLRLSAR